MHILQNNGNIIYGPAEYSVGMISYALINDLEMDIGTFTIPSKVGADEVIVLDANTSVLPARLVYPSLNSKIEQLAGPFWTFSSSEALGTYEVAPKPLDAVKNELKAQAAAVRYTKETSKLSLTVADTAIVVDGSRENKTMFMVSYGVLPENGSIAWKFENTFLNCTKANIAEIIGAFVAQTQAAFDWEASKVAEIEACTSLEDLNALVLEIPEVEGAA